jgi:hypothetical protein
VERIRNRDKKNIPKLKVGRPYKISKESRRYLARQFNVGELETMKDGQRLIQSAERIKVHRTSIRKYLNMEHMKTYIARKKPDLTETQKKARYKFAKDHIHWTIEDWKNVMFSDETVISRVGSFGRKYYYKRQEDKHIRPHHIKKTKQGGGRKIMVWGCMTYYGVGDACWIPEKINAVLYVEVLKDYVFASMDWCGMDPRKFIFQQDNAKIHTAKVTKDYIRKSKIPLMDWPANSPDLNPMETIWAYLKGQLDQYTNDPKDVNELWERIQDIWTKIPIEFIEKLYNSMPDRVREVYRCKGDITRY